MRAFGSRVLSEDRFVVRERGRWLATPLVVVLVCVEVTDLMFATDSIPAIFAVTLDPFILYTSNVFAILGLRSLLRAGRSNEPVPPPPTWLGRGAGVHRRKNAPGTHRVENRYATRPAGGCDSVDHFRHRLSNSQRSAT